MYENYYDDDGELPPPSDDAGDYNHRNYDEDEEENANGLNDGNQDGYSDIRLVGKKRQ